MSIPVALQLYAVRNECEKDLSATLASLAKLGYQGAEPWGYNGEKLEWLGRSPADVRKLFDQNGLTCCGIHLATAALEKNLERTTELCQTLGCKFLIIAADKQRMSSQAGIEELAGILNNASEKLGPLDMACGYHAHGFDFQEIEGQTAWDILFSKTNKEVIMQMDIGNCLSGGGDPVATLKKFPNRTRSLHLKDHGGGPEAALGEGNVDWNEVFSTCKEHQTAIEWYVIEEGEAGGAGFEIADRSLKNLRKFIG